MKLTEHFALEELISSHIAKAHNIDNYPNAEQIANLKALCENVLQPARDAIGAIKVNSGYRSYALNLKIKGAKNSQHKEGKAADIVCSDNAKLFNWIRNNCSTDQLIWEFGNDKQPGWVHVSYNGDKNRNEVLVINKNGAKRL